MEATIGFGDELLSTGMAKGAHARGKKVAFGNGSEIIWHRYAEIVFRNNPNVARPGSERDPNIEWIRHYAGWRMYNRRNGDFWVWNMDFRPIAGEFYFSPDELSWADRQGRGYIVIEPNLPSFKSSSANKQWPVERYFAVAEELRNQGHEIVEFSYGENKHIPKARLVKPPTFRHAAACLARTKLFIGPEGGLHHASAAVNIPAVVIFGGFIPPEITGYPTHTNITGKFEGKACGSLVPCDHCKQILKSIKTEEVLEAAQKYLAS